MDKVSPEPNTGCWLWLAGVNRSGYGHFSVKSVSKLAHRAAYELFVGKIPRGLGLDHLCRVRSCVNPAHLEPVTQKENCVRARSTDHSGHDCVWRSYLYCRTCGNKKQRRLHRARRLAA